MKKKSILKVTSKILEQNFSTWFLNKIGRTKDDSFYKFYVDGSYNHEVYLRVIIPFGHFNYFGSHVEQKFFSHVKKPLYKFLSSLVDFKKEHIVMSFIKKNCDIVDSPSTSVQFFDCSDDLPF